jgi:hypothetical protein
VNLILTVTVDRPAVAVTVDPPRPAVRVEVMPGTATINHTARPGRVTYVPPAGRCRRPAGVIPGRLSALSPARRRYRRRTTAR